MQNGDVNEFVDHIRYGDELWFLFGGKKYFPEGRKSDGILELLLYEMTDGGKSYVWRGDEINYPVDKFPEAGIWNGKTFWEVEADMKWVDE